MTLEELYKIIGERKKEMTTESYVASLFRDGRDRIIQKVGEEATEVVIAAKNTDKNRQIEEITDLVFHLLILMNELNINLKDIWRELEKRHGEKS